MLHCEFRIHRLNFQKCNKQHCLYIFKHENFEEALNKTFGTEFEPEFIMRYRRDSEASDAQITALEGKKCYLRHIVSYTKRFLALQMDHMVDIIIDERCTQNMSRYM